MSTFALPYTDPITRAAYGIRMLGRVSTFPYLLLCNMFSEFYFIFCFTVPVALPLASPPKFRVSTLCSIIATISSS